MKFCERIILFFIITIVGVGCKGKSPRAYLEFTVLNNNETAPINLVEIWAVNKKRDGSNANSVKIFSLNDKLNPRERTEVFRYFYRDFSQTGEGSIYMTVQSSGKPNIESQRIGTYKRFLNDAHRDSTPANWKTYEISLMQDEQVGITLTYYKNGEKAI